MNDFHSRLHTQREWVAQLGSHSASDQDPHLLSAAAVKVLF